MSKIETLKSRNIKNVKILEKLSNAKRQPRSVPAEAEEAQETQKRRPKIYKQIDPEAPMIWQYGKSPAEMLKHQMDVLYGLLSVWPKRKPGTKANLLFALKMERGIVVLSDHLETLLPVIAHPISYGVWTLDDEYVT